MKKTQVALAALALVASTAALANDVTIYGNLDVGVGKSTDQTTKFQGSGGFIAGNLWGLKGSEDLGNGLKAGFVLEQGIDLNGNVDNGGNGSLFNRQGYVSLGSNDVGTFAFGQQLSPFIAAMAGNTAGNGYFFVNRLIMGAPGTFNAAAGPALQTCATFDPVSGAPVAPGKACGTGMQQGGFFQQNAVTYSSPTINGWTAQVMQTLKQGAANTNALTGAQNNAVNADGYTAVNLAGSVAGIGLNFAYQKRSETYTTTGIGFTAPVGSFSVAGTYMRNKSEAGGFDSDADGKVSSYSLSVSYPLSDATTAAIQYAANDADDGQGVKDQSLVALQLQHKLSKRTSLYASWTQGTHGAQSDYANRGTGSGLEAKTRSTYVAGIATSF